MRALVLLLMVVVAPVSRPRPLVAQGSDSAGADTARIDTLQTLQADTGRVDGADTGALAPQAPPEPTPEQLRYLDGLRRVGRGISQLKTAVDQATRARAGTDSVAQRRARARLGGYCGSARSFMSGGRAHMQPTVYEDTTRVKARRLTHSVDAIITYTRTCEDQAGEAPAQVMAELVKRLQAYETALVEFRSAIGIGMQSSVAPGP